jgi:exosome complex RNA-binding protein Rrp42 (RNase PH superfamily)
MSEIYQRLFPQEFLKKFLLNNIRQDSRSLTQYRPITIESHPLPQCNSSSRVSIGNTSVLCSLTYELGLPSLFNQRQGQVHVKINASPTAGAHIADMHPRDRHEETDSLRHLLQNLIIQEKLLDLSHLYITDKCVWNVYADIDIVSHDGNVFDAILLAFQHAVKLTEVLYGKNMPFLPQFYLKRREVMYNERIEHEKVLKSTQDDYKTSLMMLLPPPNNHHIEIPKLLFDFEKITTTQNNVTTNIQCNQMKQIGILSQDDINRIETEGVINTLESPAPYNTLLYPPIIMTKQLYPTSMAIIPIQEVKYPKNDNNDEENEKDEKIDHKSEQILSQFDQTKLSPQTRPVITTRNLYVLDPTYIENQSATSNITVIFDQNGHICFTQKTSGSTISPTVLMKCLEIAAQHCGRLAKIIEAEVGQLMVVGSGEVGDAVETTGDGKGMEEQMDSRDNGKKKKVEKKKK